MLVSVSTYNSKSLKVVEIFGFRFGFSLERAYITQNITLINLEFYWNN